MTNAATDARDEPIRIESADHFEEVVDRDGVVLVDFHAEWCGPCKMLEPTVEAVAAETDAVVATVDVDSHGGLAAQFGVQGVPNLVFFRDGEPQKRAVGVQSKEALTAVVASLTR
ncbi:thioredoxin [Salinigranum rubrum]|uniref:Thioredoxin n=1 Tax=Salinigranum rubrum TaxID=755307 RepID=A0A2I8VNA5_9EURY|nr:thioredoxin domain-containing protein [Salinigranum rubrum]AUV83375.1 thioredoxin [Salinigranum rubrum]